jgi:hypothetical protein
MIRLRSIALLALCLGACRDYPYEKTISRQAGLIPPAQFARYGREEAIAVAIGRELARPYNAGPAALAEVATAYARKFPDVTNVVADPLGYRLTLQYRSNWRTAVVPIADGKTGDETKIPQ